MLSTFDTLAGAKAAVETLFENQANTITEGGSILRSLLRVTSGC
jgi:hypothetical protein